MDTYLLLYGVIALSLVLAGIIVWIMESFSTRTAVIILLTMLLSAPLVLCAFNPTF